MPSLPLYFLFSPIVSGVHDPFCCVGCTPSPDETQTKERKGKKGKKDQEPIGRSLNSKCISRWFRLGTMPYTDAHQCKCPDAKPNDRKRSNKKLSSPGQPRRTEPQSEEQMYIICSRKFSWSHKKCHGRKPKQSQNHACASSPHDDQH